MDWIKILFGCLDEAKHDEHQLPGCTHPFQGNLHTTDETIETRAAVAANDDHTNGENADHAEHLVEDAHRIYRHAPARDIQGMSMVSANEMA